MWRLYQYPLCPFSRKVRLALAAGGEDHEDLSLPFQLPDGLDGKIRGLEMVYDAHVPFIVLDKPPSQGVFFVK